MKYIKLGIVVLITYLIQTTIMTELNIWGIPCNLFLVVTCGISFLFGSTVGGTIGFALGILQDLSQGRAIGLCAALGMYIGIVMGTFNRRFFKDNYIVAIIFIAFATIFYETFVYFFGAAAYGQAFVFAAFIGKILLATLMNILASVVTYPILLKLNIGIEVDRNIFGR